MNSNHCMHYEPTQSENNVAEPDSLLAKEYHEVSHAAEDSDDGEGDEALQADAWSQR